MARTTDIDEVVLEELLVLVDHGIEYPEAHTRVVLRHHVDGDALTAAYDKHCIYG